MSASIIEPCGKTCCECRQDRPINAFPYSKFSPDGRTSKCMRCIAAAAQQSRLAREIKRPGPAPRPVKLRPRARPDTQQFIATEQR